MLIRYDVDDMTRFPTAMKFAGDTGLVPSIYASANHVSHGPLTKQGNKWLRWARIKVRRGAQDARVCTARKLAELAWTVWTQQQCYKTR